MTFADDVQDQLRKLPRLCQLLCIGPLDKRDGYSVLDLTYRIRALNDFIQESKDLFSSIGIASAEIGEASHLDVQ